jgi:hypothetical protein
MPAKCRRSRWTTGVASVYVNGPVLDDARREFESRSVGEWTDVRTGYVDAALAASRRSTCINQRVAEFASSIHGDRVGRIFELLTSHLTSIERAKISATNRAGTTYISVSIDGIASR